MLIKPNYLVIPHWHSTTVSLEIYTINTSLTTFFNLWQNNCLWNIPLKMWLPDFSTRNRNGSLQSSTASRQTFFLSRQNNYLLVNLMDRSMGCSTMYTIKSSNLQINFPYFALSLNITNLFLYIPVFILHKPSFKSPTSSMFIEEWRKLSIYHTESYSYISIGLNNI